MTNTIECPKCKGELELHYDRHTADDGVFYLLDELECFDKCEFSADEVEQIDNDNPLTMEDIDNSLNAMFELEAELAYDGGY
jgi:C4-type Zn-finger protein